MISKDILKRIYDTYDDERLTNEYSILLRMMEIDDIGKTQIQDYLEEIRVIISRVIADRVVHERSTKGKIVQMRFADNGI